LSEEQSEFLTGDLVMVCDHKKRYWDELGVIVGFSEGTSGLWDTYRVYFINKSAFFRCYNNEMRLISKYEKEY